MNWFRLNTPLTAIVFAAWIGVPLRLVLKHPDTGPEPRDAQRPTHAAGRHRRRRPSPRLRLRLRRMPGIRPAGFSAIPRESNPQWQ
jgi:hypothetical protein